LALPDQDPELGVLLIFYEYELHAPVFPAVFHIEEAHHRLAGPQALNAQPSGIHPIATNIVRTSSALPVESGMSSLVSSVWILAWSSPAS
jgi:hypothetical protein